jgi:hypothetical protein
MEGINPHSGRIYGSAGGLSFAWCARCAKNVFQMDAEPDAVRLHSTGQRLIAEQMLNNM